MYLLLDEGVDSLQHPLTGELVRQVGLDLSVTAGRFSHEEQQLLCRKLLHSPSGSGWSGWPAPPQRGCRCPPSRRAAARCKPRRTGAVRSAVDGHEVRKKQGGGKVKLTPTLTSLSVGLPLKKSVFLLLFGGLNLGLRKAQPLAMASKGAGPSYGKDRPTNNCRERQKKSLDFSS